jgi:hypothetical protein
MEHLSIPTSIDDWLDKCDCLCKGCRNMCGKGVHSVIHAIVQLVFGLALLECSRDDPVDMPNIVVYVVSHICASQEFNELP